jgi:hypothetical protein
MGITLSMSRDFKYSTGSVACRKLQSVVHTCEEREEGAWAQVVLLMTEDLGPCAV